ncbi:MAG: histidine kinase [Dysgonomonas sp.]|nr:histidine kinase [Dysgonomonas sp.]
METKGFFSQLKKFASSIQFTLFMTLIFIFQADTYRLIDADIEREKVWRIALSLFSILIICISTYLANLGLKKKIKGKYMVAVSSGMLGAIFSIGYSYLGYQGLILSLFFITRSLLIGFLFALVYDWYRKSLKQKDLEKQNIKSELALLKNQINPHFLFNTLNNIDSLIRSNPDKASKSLVELSDIMRYMIYETNISKVPLKQELDYIDNYLKLQSLQYANPNLVNYDIKGNIENIRIAPMLFIPFIENAFKHCTNKEKENAIRFSFEINNHILTFTSVNIADKKYTIAKDKSRGVGLEIVKRRLDLLYMGKYQLEIKEENNMFSIYLTIEIDD